MSEHYLRYTLRLARAAGAGLREARDERVRAGLEPEVDDWSGAAAYAWRPDEAVLDYAHPQAVALLEALQPNGWQEEDDGDTLIFWLPAGAAPELAGLRALGDLTITSEEPGWQDAWRRFHHPHRIGAIYVRPPWEPPLAETLDLIIDAGRAFGTGGHATTRQCIAALQEIDERGELLDLGCGSGVVALAARQLGFAPVSGIDVDPAAIAEALDNAARNGLAARFSVGDATDAGAELPAAATVVANIALGPILRLAPRFAAPRPDAAPDGEGAPALDAGAALGGDAAPDLAPRHLILAGLLDEHVDAALAAFPAYELASRLNEEMWVALRLVRRR